jgi:hypothetical protein
MFQFHIRKVTQKDCCSHEIHEAAKPGAGCIKLATPGDAVPERRL